MRMLIMGPPGSGKGTQAALIAEHFGVTAISTGDIFRANVESLTPLGIAAKKYIDSGDFVPDEITNAMICVRLQQADTSSGFLLDGYPRTAEQVQFLDDVLAADRTVLDAVLKLRVHDAEIITRLLERSAAEGRSDDTEDVIRHRLNLYHLQTEPIAARYAGQGRLFSIDGTGPIEEVTGRALDALVAADKTPVSTPV